MSTTTAPLLSEIRIAARALGVSDSLLRKMERQRKIPPAIRTVGGQRLYSPELIEVIRATRTAAQAARRGAA